MLRVFAQRKDHGAVAIIVAIAALTLMAFGALAVDLGNAWARKRAIQTTADLAALAGAAGLPDVQTARGLAVRYLEKNRDPIGNADYSCPLTPVTCWDNDGDYDNGEIDFYAADTNDDRRYTSTSPDERTTGTDAVAIRVVPPRGRVDFGLAGAIGMSSVDVTEPATAQIGSALGLGVPPFYLVPGDGGLECIKDGTAGPSPSRIPGWGLRAGHNISGINPTSGPVGTSVTVTGLGLPTGNGDKATVGGADATVTSRSSSAWTIVVPALATGTYDVVIPDGNGPTKHDATFSGFTVTGPAPAPSGITLSSLSPDNGEVGSIVTINGVNLPTGGGSTARFGSQPATIDSRTSTQWVVRVPTLPTGPVQVVVSQGSNNSNPLTYTVTAPPLPPKPVLTDLDPDQGPKGSTVTITGTNLPATGGVVRFGSAIATITAQSATSMQVTVPDLAPGPYDVVVNNGTDSDPLPFTVIDPACDAVSSNRGYISAPRENDNGNVVDINIREGLDHNLHVWMKWPAAGAPRATPTTGDACTDAAPDVHPFPSGPAWLADVNCLELRTGNIGGELKKGFFSSGAANDGRLYQLCGGPTITTGPGTGADDNRLWQTRFIDTDHGSIAALRTRIENGVPAGPSDGGWITDEVFACPRFAVLPVLNAPDDAADGSGQFFRVIGFKAVWFDDDTADHGFLWQGNNSLQRVRAYVFDADYLPEEVSAEIAGEIGPYIEGLPKVIQLVHDESDPAT